MVEFALVVPLILVLFLGLVEFGHGLNSYLTVVASARDAARLGAQGGATDAALLNMVAKETERLPSVLPATSENCGPGQGVCIEAPGVSAGTTALRVKVCYDHPMLVGVPGFGDSIHMCSQTTMRVSSGS